MPVARLKNQLSYAEELDVFRQAADRAREAVPDAEAELEDCILRADEMGLKKGDIAAALIKSTEVMIVRP